MTDVEIRLAAFDRAKALAPPAASVNAVVETALWLEQWLKQAGQKEEKPQ